MQCSCVVTGDIIATGVLRQLTRRVREGQRTTTESCKHGLAAPTSQLPTRQHRRTPTHQHQHQHHITHHTTQNKVVDVDDDNSNDDDSNEDNNATQRNANATRNSDAQATHRHTKRRRRVHTQKSFATICMRCVVKHVVFRCGGNALTISLTWRK